MRKKLKELLSIQIAKQPGRLVLAVILLFNVCFLVLSAAIISGFSVRGTEGMGFWQAMFYTITMILDAGCIQFVIEDIGTSGVVIIVLCLIIIVIGMVTFTGAVIGYLTNYISKFIENANSGSRKLHLSGHSVILNWNTRAAEIVNDMLYCETGQRIVILANRDKSEIEREINECISDTVAREEAAVRRESENMPFFKGLRYKRAHGMKNHLTIIVRNGDPYSSKQLHDISLEKAKSIIILGNDINGSVCKYDYAHKMDSYERGNPQTIKTLIQVAEITGAADSNDNQKVIVEVDDEWTMDLVNKIIRTKQVHGKSNIVPIEVNKILGQILSQFSLMPELNIVYKELFSNKGAAFFSKEMQADDISYNKLYLEDHKWAIPLTCMYDGEKYHYYYAAGSEKDIERIDKIGKSGYTVELNKDYWLLKKKIIILGHNSKCRDTMAGFDAFRSEWNRDNGEEIVEIVVIDTPKNLEKMNYYKEYPYVVDVVEAEIYDKDIIIDTINSVVDKDDEDTSILILSDDMVSNEEIDASALANLVYVQDIVKQRKLDNPDFDTDRIDVIVEILNPKNHDIVTSYSINNVVISNRYISKMITQIGEKDSLFYFYNDILTYDEDCSDGYESKEIYIKRVYRFFNETPKNCTADQLIRAVYNKSIEDNTDKKRDMSIVLGYIKRDGNMVLFNGNQSKIDVSLEPEDKLILFSNH